MKTKTKARVPPVESGYHKDAVALAKWIHESVPNSIEWRTLAPQTKEKYLLVATAMLLNPPPVLRQAVRRLEGF